MFFVFIFATSCSKSSSSGALDQIRVFEADLEAGDVYSATSMTHSFIIFTRFAFCDIEIVKHDSDGGNSTYRYTPKTVPLFEATKLSSVTVTLTAKASTRIKFGFFYDSNCFDDDVTYGGNTDFYVSFSPSHSNYALRSYKYTTKCIVGLFDNEALFSFSPNFWFSSGIPSIGGTYFEGAIRYIGHNSDYYYNKEVTRLSLPARDDAFIFEFSPNDYGGMLGCSISTIGSSPTREYKGYIYNTHSYSDSDRVVEESSTSSKSLNPTTNYIISIVIFIVFVILGFIIGYCCIYKKKKKEELSDLTDSSDLLQTALI